MGEEIMNRKCTGLLVLLIFATAFFFSCSKKQEQQKPATAEMPLASKKEADESHPMNASPESTKTFISPERQQTIGSRSAPAERKEISREIRAVGRAAYDETRLTHVHTRVNGWVQETFV